MNYIYVRIGMPYSASVLWFSFKNTMQRFKLNKVVIYIIFKVSVINLVIYCTIFYCVCTVWYICNCDNLIRQWVMLGFLEGNNLNYIRDSFIKRHWTELDWLFPILIVYHSDVYICIIWLNATKIYQKKSIKKQ